jgi:outer membrane protein assembly factor BamB
MPCDLIRNAQILLLALNFCAIGMLGATESAESSDWPQFGGPDRNGISKETGWSSSWPKDGPPIVWKRAVGCGFSNPAIAGNQLFIEGTYGSRNRLWCLDASTGESKWTYDYDLPLKAGKIMRFSFTGPAATPTVDGERLYVCSRGGQVFCFEAATGKMLWQAVNGIKTDTYGLACSPLILGNQVIVVAGGAGNLVVSFDKMTGKKLWGGGDDRAAYASPTAFQHKSGPALVVLGQSQIVGLSAADGKVLFTQPWLQHRNTADIVVVGDRLVVVSSATVGSDARQASRQYRIPEEPGPLVEVCAYERLTQLCAPMVWKGCLFGFKGNWGRLPKYQDNFALNCMDFETGKVRWSQAGISGAAMISDGKLLILSIKGELVIAEANIEKYVELGRVKVVEGWCYSPPVLANGRIYCRNSGDDLSEGTMGRPPEQLKGGWLACVDVRVGAQMGAVTKVYPREAPPEASK